MFTKPRRFSACSAPAFVQRQLGFFVESSGSVNLLRMERTSLRASSSTCFLRSCHQNLLQWNDVLFIRSQPLLLRRCNKVCEIRGHRSCAFESRMLSLQVHVAKVTKSQYTKSLGVPLALSNSRIRHTIDVPPGSFLRLTCIPSLHNAMCHAAHAVPVLNRSS